MPNRAVATKLSSRTVRAAAGLVGAVLFAGCSKTAPEPPSPPPVAVTVEAATPGPFERWLAATGSVEPTVFAGLASPAEGPVIARRVREGDHVVPGQELLRIGRQASAVATLASAREELRRTEADLRRVEILVAEKAVAGSQLDAARAAFERARAAVAQAQQAEGDFIIRAPWRGIVSSVHVAEGNFVAPRAVLVELFDPASLVLRFAVDEQDAPGIVPGGKIHASFDAVPDRMFDLDIVREYPSLDRRLRTRTFEASVPANVALAPGMFARLRIVREAYADALTIASESMLRDGEKAFIFVVEDGRAVRREVGPVFEQDGRIMLRSGLQPGDRVIVGGIERVKDGAAVRIESPGQ